MSFWPWKTVWNSFQQPRNPEAEERRRLAAPRRPRRNNSHSSRKSSRCSSIRCLPVVLFGGMAGDACSCRPGSRWSVLLAASIFFYAALHAPLLIVAWAFVVAVSFCCWIANCGFLREAARKHAVDQNCRQSRRSGWDQVPAAADSRRVSGRSTDNRWFVTLGVSYYTLQAISYLADVYLGTAEPERHVGRLRFTWASSRTAPGANRACWRPSAAVAAAARVRL